MIQPTKPGDLHDDEPPLGPRPSPLDDQPDGEEAYLPEGDDDLDLFGSDESEEVGLDTDAGLDESLEGELQVDESQEGLSLCDDSELAEDLDQEDHEDDAAAQEYGWTGEDDAPAEELVLDDDLPEDEGRAIDDSGEEGFDEDPSSEIDLGALPPIDADETPDSSVAEDPSELELTGELLVADADDEEGGPGGESGWARLPGGSVVVERIADATVPARLLSVAAGVGLFWDGALCVAEPGCGVERRFARARAARGLAAVADEATGVLHVALLADERLLCSRDGGRSFEEVTLPETAPIAHVGFTKDGGDVRLWAAVDEGALWVANAGGETPRLAQQSDLSISGLWTDSGNGLGVLACDSDGAPVLWHSTDGGGRFSACELPIGDALRLRSVAVQGRSIALHRSAPDPQLLHSAAGGAWCELLPQGRAPYCLLDDDGEVFAYACVEAPAGLVLVRRAVSPHRRAPEVVCELPVETLDAATMAAHCADGVTHIYLGAGGLLYRITLGSAA